MIIIQILAWIAAIIIAIALIISWSNELHNRWLRRKISATDGLHIPMVQGKEGHTFILVPGILARSDEQFQSLVPTFKEMGSVTFLDYQGRGYDLNRATQQLMAAVKYYLKSGRVTIVGASLGGYATFNVLKAFQGDDRVSGQMIDTPYGVETLTAMPNRLSWIFKIFPSAPLPEFLGNRLLMMMRVPPKNENIVVPEGVNAEEYQKLIIEQAMTNLSGHSFVRYWEQLAMMVKMRPQPIGESLNMTYVMCNGEGNDVVVQPMAASRWSRVIPNLQISAVHGVHCGFLEQAPFWAQLFKGLPANQQ